MGGSMDALEGSCSQNTLKNKRLEHWRYGQERNCIDRERLSGEMNSRVLKPSVLWVLELGINLSIDLSIYLLIYLSGYIYISIYISALT
jgi:hypothetical protein